MRTTATTRYGQVEGTESNGIAAFKGIPYAAPPVGARRWAPPERPEPWSGLRAAKAFSAVAPQNKVALDILKAFSLDDPQSEDCLTLNVWTPGADGERRPVLVWTHGGAFQIGSSSQNLYDGEPLARRGNVVVVTINYRLGPLGFLPLAEVTGGRIPATGNEGLLDQIAALQWVRENVAAFGGDPGCLTLFGESAGGMSCGSLLGLSQARGLFHRAIPQSGACNTAGTAERAVRLGERFCRELGVSPRDADGLRAVPAERLLAAERAIVGVVADPTTSEFGMIWQPTIDGKVMARRAIDSVRAGSAAGVAVMAGSTLDEWNLLGANPGTLALNDAGVDERVRTALRGYPHAAVMDTYRKALPARGKQGSAVEVLMAIETDRVFRIPALRLLEAQAAHDPRTYAYLFTWPSPMFGGMLASCHALELGFMFGTHRHEGMPEFCGSGPAADALAASMMDAWLAFARTGDPSSAGVGKWPAHTTRDRATMLLGEKCELARAPYEAERRAWDGAGDSVVGAL
jgi:para-nitrobenzyl esterase